MVVGFCRKTLMFLSIHGKSRKWCRNIYDDNGDTFAMVEEIGVSCPQADLPERQITR